MSFGRSLPNCCSRPAYVCYKNGERSSCLVASTVSFSIRWHFAMSKRRNESDASAPFEGLIKSLKSADNDGNRLEEIVSKRDSASTADVLAVPLSGARFPSVNESKLKVRLSDNKTWNEVYSISRLSKGFDRDIICWTGVHLPQAHLGGLTSIDCWGCLFTF